MSIKAPCISVNSISCARRLVTRVGTTQRSQTPTFSSLRPPQGRLGRDSRVPIISPKALEDAVAPSAPAPDDPVIGILFSLAVVALTVLTLGVGYLSLTSWLDSRQEEEDRRKSGFAPKKAEQGTFFTQSSNEDQVSKKSKKKKGSAPKKASGKGFGN